VNLGLESATASPSGGAEALHRHRGEVWHYLRVLGCDPQAADDLCQETFLVALRKRVRFRGAAEAAVYLRRTARFLFLEHRRRRGRSREEIGSDAWVDAVDASFEASAPHDVWLAALERCRARLEGRRREAVELSYEQGLSRAEVARRMSMSEHGVRNLLHRVRAALRQCIEKGTHERSP
jgi:RNA polymerase sigma-70 factor (ECF subfamily)